MSEPKVQHTPGEWAVELDLADDGNIDVVAGDPLCDFISIASIDVWEEPDDEATPPREVALANARLIAAAPDLLAALLILHPGPERWVTPTDAQAATILAAIAKATGGSK